MMPCFFLPAFELFTLSQTPQVPPALQYLQAEQFVQAMQLALPVHLALSLQHFFFGASTGPRNNERKIRSLIIS